MRFLHKDLAERDAVIAKQEKRIAQLEGNGGVRGGSVASAAGSRPLEMVVSFSNGRAVVDAPQFPNVERVAKYLKKYPNARVEIRGYASPGGNLSANIRIAQLRAEAVQNLLIAQYGISKNRIVATGQGVGKLYAEPEWNSVAVCTILEK